MINPNPSPDRQLHPLEEAGYIIPDHWKVTLDPLVRKTCAVCRKRFIYQAVNPRKINYCSMKCRMMNQ